MGGGRGGGGKGAFGPGGLQGGRGVGMWGAGRGEVQIWYAVYSIHHAAGEQ